MVRYPRSRSLGLTRFQVVEPPGQPCNRTTAGPSAGPSRLTSKRSPSRSKASTEPLRLRLAVLVAGNVAPWDRLVGVVRRTRGTRRHVGSARFRGVGRSAPTGTCDPDGDAEDREDHEDAHQIRHVRSFPTARRPWDVPGRPSLVL